MPALLSSATSSVIQFISVLFIFVFVLAITAFATKWIANYQRDKAPGENIVIVETKRIAQNKIITIVRIGDRYFALAVGKDEANLISEISPDSLKFTQTGGEHFSFKELLSKMKNDGENITK
ncbi:MAG: flagellar biosynthetic protein FliO [Lachnospiraceae bacterium]|nr:flagellar biosynthetic protein FliO [Lachnospiraceae bacterium]